MAAGLGNVLRGKRQNGVRREAPPDLDSAAANSISGSSGIDDASEGGFGPIELRLDPLGRLTRTRGASVGAATCVWCP